MYEWRKLSDEQRRELLVERKARRHPWHSPPHRLADGCTQMVLSAACYEHAPIIGRDPQRMDQIAQVLADLGARWCERILAWCVLPDHYHVVVQTASAAQLLHEVGLMHGRTSHQWNGEESTRGRKVWHNVADRDLRSERHLWASINYVHHNPVKHGYVTRWQDWPWSSARRFLDEVGEHAARKIWLDHPILDYGKGWDE